ncbi:tudor domain-containing protein 7B [Anopheles aquasalis]|nr:tudor domain-containing protein 7B [Anopheles aquasalis]
MAGSHGGLSEEAKRLITEIRSLVASRKEPSTAQTIMRDYKAIEGEALPYRKYGFSTVEDLLQASGEFIIKRGDLGEPRIYVKVSRGGAHIMQMVQAQKSAKVSPRFAAMRTPTSMSRTNSFAGSRGSTGSSGGGTAYSRIYQQMPQNGRSIFQSSSSGSPKKASFGKSGSPKGSKAATGPSWNGTGSTTSSRGPSKSDLFYQAITDGSQNRKNGQETNNNSLATKNNNLTSTTAGGQQQQQQQQQLKGNDLRHKLDGRNTGLSRSSVDMRQGKGTLLPSNMTITVSNGTSGSYVRRLDFSDGKSGQERKVTAAVSSNKIAGSGRVIPPSVPPLPLMSLKLPQPSELTAAPKASTSSSSSLSARLQLAKGSAPPPVSTESVFRNAAATVATTSSYQRTQSLEERSSLATTSDTPFSSTTLLGRKSVQDRLTKNQRVAEQDMEKVAKVVAPLSPPVANGGTTTTVINGKAASTTASYSGKSTTAAPYTNGGGAPDTEFTWNDVNATPVELLMRYSNLKGYPRPEYRYFRLKNGRIQCQLTVNGSTYSTYPNDYGNEFECQFAAALNAIEAIRSDESRQTYSVCLDSDEEIANHIYELLVNCPHGMFSKRIPDAFEQAHRSTLPDHWFSLLDRYSNQLFVLEDCLGDTIVFAREQPSSSDAASNTSEARQMALNQLVLPWDEQYWNLYITNPVSTVEVWARLVGKEYSDKMDTLITDIEMSMLSNPLTADESVGAVGEYYLVCITDCWYRVRVDEINYESNQCQCFFIDIGERDQFALDQLYRCDPKYLQLPGQAICFTLEGLEDFNENPKAKHHLDNLISGRVFIGEILTKREVYEEAEQLGGVGTGQLKLALYDTSKEEEDVLMNPIILKHICDDTPLPELNRKTVNYVNISHVDDQGDVYCTRDGAMSYIQKLITNLTKSDVLEGKYRGLYESKVSATQQQLYLVQDDSDGKWYRAELDGEESGPYCRMLYVDVGCRRRTNVSNIYRLELLSLALSRYPPQALRMRMFNLPEERSVVSRLRALLKPAMRAMAKVCAMAPGSVPLVKIFVYVPDGSGDTGNNILVCVNDSIRDEKEFELDSELISSPRTPGANENAAASITSSSSGERDSLPNSSNSETGGTGTGYTPLANKEAKELAKRFDGLNLKPTMATQAVLVESKLAKMTLPPVGQLFDVKVTIASNPKFFIVQPYGYNLQLNRLMHELQDFCMKKAQPVRKDQVRQGEAYAAFYKDGHWYRAIVLNIIHGPKPIHVFFCDFGQFEELDVSALRILSPSFRVLPQQAIKARLHGVKPLNKGWKADDAVRFQKLVVGRKFASIVRGIETDEINPNEKLVDLELIDVSTEEDIHVHRVLVDEGRAVYTAAQTV